MAKAGDATFTTTEETFRQKPVWHYGLIFKSRGAVEKLYPMRDTLDAYFTHENGLLTFASKHSNEGDYYSVDELDFSYKEEATHVHSKRYTRTRTKIDTVLVSEGNVYDMLSATLYLRTIKWEDLKIGSEVPFKVSIGRDLVNSAFRYEGQQVIERKGIKYKTRHFYVDVYDEAFTQSKAAGEVWIGDDENHIPIKVRAKLKIGAVEVFYKSSENLKFPMSCGIELD